MLENTPSKEIMFRPASARDTLLGVLFIVLAISVYTFFTGGLSDKLDLGRADLSSKTKQLQELKDKMAELDSAQKNLDLTNEVQKIESLKAVPDKMYQDQVLKDLIQIANNYSIKLNSISFSKGSGPKPGTGSLRISAGFEGNYLDLTDFLQGLEQNARIFKVDSISVQLSKLAVSDVERANFSLTIQTFFQQGAKN